MEGFTFTETIFLPFIAAYLIPKFNRIKCSTVEKTGLEIQVMNDLKCTKTHFLSSTTEKKDIIILTMKTTGEITKFIRPFKHGETRTNNQYTTHAHFNGHFPGVNRFPLDGRNMRFWYEV